MFPENALKTWFARVLAPFFALLYSIPAREGL